MEFIKKKINELKYANYNPRKKLQPEDKEYQKIKKSIEEFGYVEPIIINKDNTIIGGHQRLTVLKDLGYEKVDVIQIDIDKTKEKALNIALNKITGEWDYAMLGDLLLDLDSLNYDLEITGFDLDEIEEIMAPIGTEEKEVIEDDFDIEPPEKPKAKYGDIYQLGNHRLMCGDSTKEEDAAKLMDGNKADMVFTDPPYGVSYTGGIQFKDGSVETNNREMIKNDNIDIYNKIFPILSKFCQGPCYIWFSFPSQSVTSMYINAEKYGTIHSLIIWVKNGGYGALNANYKQKHEPCLYWTPKSQKTNFCGSSSETTIWEINKDGINKLHPTQKPILLCSKSIKNHKCNIVLDLFGGSGSTLIACEQLDRKCYMMELDPKYVDVIIERWETFTGKKAIKIEGDE